MDGSIKLFQLVQKCHQIIGIFPSEPTQKKQSINWAKMGILIGCAEFGLTTIASLVFEAKHMFGVAIAFYIIIAIISSIFIYCGFIAQSQNTMKFIENCARFIEKSEYSSINIVIIVSRTFR